MQHGTIYAYKRKKCRCDDCRAAEATYQNKRRKTNPEPFRRSQRKFLRARKVECIAMLGGACVRCGATESLEFDHVDPSTKAFEISTYADYSWDTLLPELRKCQLLCNACHKAKTAEDRKAKVPA